jgi:hypothetical protein
MKFIKPIFLSILFILIGEIVFKLDEVLRGEHAIQEEISSKKLPNHNKKCEYNIYLLGDSYTAGQGIPKGMKISDILEFEGYCIINQTKGGDDWIDYYKKYLKIINECSKGDIVIIGINWNDILYKGNEYLYKDSVYIQNVTSKPIKTHTPHHKPWYRKLYSTSKLASTLSSNIQNTLKRHGMALPIGDFHYLNKKGYAERKIQLDEILSKIDSLNQIKKINCILYLMPEYNLLDNKKYFENYINYYNQKKIESIVVIDGFDDFNYEKGQDFMLSVHDGHPNFKAHEIISKSFLKYLTSSKSNQNHSN